MDPFSAALDFDEITARNRDTTVNLVKLMFLGSPDQEPSAAEGEALMKSLAMGLSDTMKLIGEVKRLREGRQKIRDIHSPANSNDPAAPGAICTGCSLHGSRVAWPCPTWNATEDGR